MRDLCDGACQGESLHMSPDPGSVSAYEQSGLTPVDRGLCAPRQGVQEGCSRGPLFSVAGDLNIHLPQHVWRGQWHLGLSRLATGSWGTGSG